MTVPPQYRNIYIPIKFFLNSYRALSDEQGGIQNLESHLLKSNVLLSDWKIIWIGTCAILRSSIDLFKADSKSCINEDLRSSIKQEWKIIQKKEDHPIFWEFLQKERNSILHQYEWPAYETWMDQDGTIGPDSLGLLHIKPADANYIILMRKGLYRGRNSLELLKEGAEWAETRIFSAIRRAGFDPDEERNPFDFRIRPIGSHRPSY